MDCNTYEYHYFHVRRAGSIPVVVPMRRTKWNDYRAARTSPKAVIDAMEGTLWFMADGASSFAENLAF